MITTALRRFFAVIAMQLLLLQNSMTLLELYRVMKQVTGISVRMKAAASARRKPLIQAARQPVQKKLSARNADRYTAHLHQITIQEKKSG